MGLVSITEDATLVRVDPGGGIYRVADALDVDLSGIADGDALTWNAGTSKLVPGTGGGGGAAEDVTFSPAGSVSSSDVQAAIEELDDDIGALSAPIKVAPAPSGDATGATDTAAIQALIDAAAAGGTGGTVQLCAGTYYVTGLVGGNMVTLRGAGWRTRVRAVAGITVPVIGTPVSGVIYGFEVRDLCVHGARASTSSDGINFDLSASGQPQYAAVGMPDSVCRIVNCLVLYAGRDGISIGGQDGTRPGSSGGHYVRGCYVVGAGRYGMLLNAFDALVIGCDIGASKEHGVVISANQTRVVATKSWYAGRDLYQDGGIDVIGSGSGSYDGFHIAQPSPSGNNGIQLSGCQSQDNGRYGINFNGVSGVTVSGHMFGGDVVAAFRLGNGNAVTLEGMVPNSDRGATPVLGVIDGNSSGARIRLHFDTGQATTNLFQFVNGGTFKQCDVQVYSGAGGVNNVGNVSGAQTPSALLARTWIYTFTGNGSIENARPAIAGQELVLAVTAGANTITWGSDYHTLGAALPTTGTFVVRFVNIAMNSDTPYWIQTEGPNVDLLAHLSDTSDAHDASAISFAPTGAIAATNVQDAIAEVASEAGGGGDPFMPVLWWMGGQFQASKIGTWTFATDIAYTTLQQFGNTSNAINDEVTWAFGATMPAGTYTLQLNLRKLSSGGIATVEVSADGSTWSSFTTVDCYAASDTRSIVSVTGISAAAFKYVRVRMASKNASSSGYFFLVGYLALMRTA